MRHNTGEYTTFITISFIRRCADFVRNGWKGMRKQDYIPIGGIEPAFSEGKNQTHPKKLWRNPVAMTTRSKKNTAVSLMIIFFKTISIVPKNLKKSRYKS